MVQKKTLIFKASILYDGINKSSDKYVIVEDGLITEITGKPSKADYTGILTPAFIDPHSHIGLDREGEPWQESEVNDHIDQINPLNNPLNSIYFDDRAFQDAVDFGVLYSCVVPGSGNLIGGKAVIIRNFATNRDDAELKDYGYKLALGHNPRSTVDWKGLRPTTRMGTYAMLEKRFDDLLIKKEKAENTRAKKIYELKNKNSKQKLPAAQQKKEFEFIEKEYQLEFISEEKALLELLSGNKTAKIHVHKDDDVRYLIKLTTKYGLKSTADHTGDVFHQQTFDLLGQNNIPVVYGPLGSLGYKVELKHAYYQNAGLLMKSKANFGLMTDHPVIHTMALRDSLKFFLIQGMSDYEAINLITRKNAEILGIDNILGTVEKGKSASMILWDKDPLNLASYPMVVMGEGKILRNRFEFSGR